PPRSGGRRGARAADRPRLRPHPGAGQPRRGRRPRRVGPCARAARRPPAVRRPGRRRRGAGALPVIRAASAILAKDLRLELRTKESVPAMTLFTVTVYVLFHFGLDRNSLDGSLAAGVLWVTLLLAAVVGVARLFAAEREQGGIDGLLLAPIDRTSLFLAKGAALFLFLCAVELVALPAFALLLLGPDLLDP